MEYDKEQLEKQWQARFDREEEYISLIRELIKAKKDGLNNPAYMADNAVLFQIKLAETKIEIFDLETNIKAKQHYLESIKQDKAQQEAFMNAKIKFIDENATAILGKARNSITARSDRAKILDTLLSEMPQRETPEWYARIWEINEHVRAAKVPTTNLTVEK